MDPGTALGVASLGYDVIKDLYEYYRTWKDCEKDVAELRSRLLWLGSAFKAAGEILDRHDTSNNDQSLVQSALVGCDHAIKELKETLDKISSTEGQMQTALQRLQKHGRRAIYPFKKSTILALMENVETCQASLQFVVNLLGLDTGASTLESLLLLDEKLTHGLEDLDSELKQLQLTQTSNNSKLLDEIKASASNLEQSLKSKEDKEKAQMIVNSLSTGELRRRRQDVRENHPETLNSILDDEDSSLAKWLQRGNGLFWIRGKAGSGKSTLMKFLVEDERTEDLLRVWAGSNEVCIVQHFFWIAGTPLQKSHRGMLQDLLYQILNSDHTLVPLVCHKRWKSPNPVGQDWTTKELSSVLEAAVAKSQRHICTFIGGLDEYAPDVEHDILITFVEHLASCKTIKLVVSSRPWQAFELAFGQKDNRLHIEDLTMNDILRYTWSRLIQTWNPETKMQLHTSPTGDVSIAEPSTDKDEEMADLIRTIVDKSMGVWLWVSLVADALCERLRAKRTIADLQRHVDGLPADLHDYFRDMILNRIAKTWRAETALVLKFKTMATEFEFWLEIASLWALAKDGPEFFEDSEFHAKAAFSTNECDRVDIFCKIKDLVHQCCRDLIVVHDMPRRKWLVVDYSHRTVHDFLMQPEIQRSLAIDLPRHFEQRFLFSKLVIWETKFMMKDHSSPYLILVVLLRSMVSTSFRTGSAPVLEDYFEVMPITLLKMHGELLMEYLGLCSSQLFEKENLGIVCGFGIVFLWMLRRRGLESLGQELLDKVSSKWPSILRSPFWLGEAETATEYVNMGAIDLDRGETYLKILFEDGVGALTDSIEASNRRIQSLHSSPR